jgi:hypothetical protein
MNLPNQWTEYQSQLEAHFDADGYLDPAERALLTELDQLVLVVITALALLRIGTVPDRLILARPAFLDDLIRRAARLLGCRRIA